MNIRPYYCVAWIAGSIVAFSVLKAEEPALPTKTNEAELRLMVDDDRITAFDPLPLKIVVINGTKDTVRLPFGLSESSGVKVFVQYKDQAETEVIPDFGTIGKQIWFDVDFARMMPGAKFTGHVLLDFYGEQRDFVFSKIGKYRVRAECRTRGGMLRSESITIDVVKSYAGPLKKQLDRERSLLSEVFTMSSTVMKDEKSLATVNDIAYSLPEGSSLRNWLLDCLLILQFRREPDSKKALEKLLERAKGRPQVAGEVFAIELAGDLLHKPVGPPIPTKSLEEQLREAIIEDGNIDYAEKVMNTFLTEPGQYRSTFLETIRDRREKQELRKSPQPQPAQP